MDLNTQYMIPAEACRVLNVGQSELKSLVWSKKLETVLVGGRVMLYRAEVDRLAAKGGVVIPSTPDAWVRQKKLQEQYGLPSNPVDVNTVQVAP